MANELMTASSATIMERVMIVGDLAQLTPQERVNYYGAVCKSVGLNPLTKPFDYITLNGKLTLYAKKDAADQLRRLNNISIGKPEIRFEDDLIIVTVEAHDGQGRTDSDVGVVKKGDMRGDAANALMKAITKAKRRVTLSICGLGWLDETEVEAIPDARPAAVRDDGVIDATPDPRPMPVAQAIPPAQPDAWKDEVTGLAHTAKALAAVETEPMTASLLTTAVERARGLFRLNGSATAADIDTVRAALQKAISAAKPS